MAIEIADLSTLYSANTTVDINQKAMMPGFFNQNWQSEIQGHNKVVIQDYEYNTAPSNRTRGADRIAAKESSAKQLVLEINHRAEQANSIDYEDVDEIPTDILSRVRQSQAATMAAGHPNSIDTILFTAFTGYTYSTAQTRTLGTATKDFIDFNEPYEGTGKGYRLVYDAIRAFELYLYRLNVLDPGMLIGGEVGSPWMIMSPELMDGFVAWMADNNYHWDSLTSASLVNSSVLGTERFRGRLRGIELYVTNNFPVPGDRQWKIYGGTNQCATYATKPPLVMIYPPDSPGLTAYEWELRQVVRYAEKEINPQLKFLVNIRQK